MAAKKSYLEHRPVRLSEITPNESVAYSLALEEETRQMRVFDLVVGWVLAVLISFEEFSQQYLANRTFTLKDLSAGNLSLIFFFVSCTVYRAVK
jgi:hypothetical protein